jgi:hypothetical protein
MDLSQCKCGFSLEWIEDLDRYLIRTPIIKDEVTQGEQKVEKEEEESKPLKAEEWICEGCDHINIIDLDDKYSQFCKSKYSHRMKSMSLECDKKNEIIED